MRRALIALMATFFGTSVADTEHIVFTTRTVWGSPVVVSDPVTSKEFGFDSVTLRNYSTQAIAGLDLKVVLVTQEVDGARIHVALDAGTSQKTDVYLARIKAVQQKAHAMHLDPAITVLTVVSVDFADGTYWNSGDAQPPMDFPVTPNQFRRK